jgi:hypothetical protein
MRQYEGIANIGRLKDDDIRDAIRRIDRYLRQLSAIAGAIGPGQFTGGASGGGSIGGGSTATEYTDGQAVAVPVGGAILGWDGTNVQVIKTDTDGNLQVDVLSVTGTVTVDTELPAATTLLDTVTNPSTSVIAAYGVARDEGATTYSRISGELSSVDTEAGNDGDFAEHTSDVVKNYYLTPTNIAIVYDDSPTTATSDAIDVRRFRKGLFMFNLDSTLTPTDITFEILFSETSGGTYYTYVKDEWANLIFDDTVCATAINRCYGFDVLGNYMKIKVTATGTTSTNTFTVANPRIALKN